MLQRNLGTQGLRVPAIGLGCMGMTAFYDNVDPAETEEASLDAIAKSVEAGSNFLDTAWVYQSFKNGTLHTNEALVGKAIARLGRENLIIATKFGIFPQPDGTRKTCGKPEKIREQLEQSLSRLNTTYIDLYYMHRMDPTTPIEETMQCLKELIDEGKIRYIGLSECSPTELRRACAVHPVSAIQMEWSLNTRDLETTVIPVARELGVGIVAYSPLGRGLLSNTFSSAESIPENDFRRHLPRFSGENMQKNLPVSFFDLAARRGCTPAQLALAWVIAQGPDVVPIPGSKSASRILENIGAVAIAESLTAEDLAEIEASVPEIVGDRYTTEMMSSTFNERL